MLVNLLNFRPGMERLETREVPSGTPTEAEETPPAESETPPAETETPPAESETPTDTETETPPKATPPAGTRTETGTEALPPPVTPPPAVQTAAPPTTTSTYESQLTASQRFVVHLYKDVLGRNADSSGLAYWSTNLDLGTFTQGQVSIAFVTSDEYRANTIRGYYQDILGRTPDVSEVDGYMGLFRAGQSQDAIRERFLASDEFSARFSHNSAAFVAQLYSQVLGRTGSADEVNFWVNVLTTTNGDRTRVANSFLTSTEYLQVEVGAVYTVFLQRLPDAAGFNYWVGERVRGQTIEMVATGILASAEYFQRGGVYLQPAA
jgi:hypothetical protein